MGLGREDELETRSVSEELGEGRGAGRFNDTAKFTTDMEREWERMEEMDGRDGRGGEAGGCVQGKRQNETRRDETKSNNEME